MRSVAPGPPGPPYRGGAGPPHGMVTRPPLAAGGGVPFRGGHFAPAGPNIPPATQRAIQMIGKHKMGGVRIISGTQPVVPVHAAHNMAASAKVQSHPIAQLTRPADKLI